MENEIRTRIRWLDQGIVKKQLDIVSTYHYVQNQRKQMMKSRENGQKPRAILGNFLVTWRSNISKLQIF